MKLLSLLIATVLLAPQSSRGEDIPNAAIDYPGFQKDSLRAGEVRLRRRISEKEFAAMAAEPGTIVLDARSADKFQLRHIKGAANLPYTDFNAEALAKAIPAKTTRVLIYCNNNFLGAPKSLPTKAVAAPLNISTFIALTSYGYTNVYELGPLLDVKTTKLPFAGSEVEAANRSAR